MLTTNPAHAALLDSLGPLVIVELLTITLQSGDSLRYCSAAVPLTYNGQVYQPMVWEHGEINLSLGLTVDTLEIMFYPRIYPISCQDPAQEDQILGIPWIKAVSQGLLQGAELSLDRGDIDPLQGPEIIGSLNEFTGKVGTPSLETGLKLVVNSGLEVLNRMIPTAIYQPTCRYRVFDAGCGLNPDDWLVTDQVGSGSDSLKLLCGLTPAADYFARGIIEFSSGPNAGTRRAIKTSGPGWLVLGAPLFNPPGAGDLFKAWPGCDRTRVTCGTKFYNFQADGVTLRFSGEPFVPPPQTAM